MNKTSMQVAYLGPALEAGEMDVRDLAPALLAFGDLLQNASTTVYGPKAGVSVKVKATGQGSFLVDFDIHSFYLAAKSLLVGDDIGAAKNLIVLLFGGGGLFQLIKWLRKRKPEKVTTLENGNVRIEVGGEAKDINVNVWNLVNNGAVDLAARGVLKPLESDGVEVFEARSDGKPLQSVVKEDLPSFAPVDFAIPEEQISESERVGAFEVVVLSFTDRYKWRLSDGDAIFTVDIIDDKFFDDLQNRRIAFGKGDVLKVRLRSRTMRAEKGLRTINDVVEVLEIIPSPRQFPFMG